MESGLGSIYIESITFTIHSINLQFLSIQIVISIILNIHLKKQTNENYLYENNKNY